jgi:hypothetical protein
MSIPPRDRVLAPLLLLGHAGLLAWAATCHSPHLDEVGHLPAGISHWQLGRFDLYRVNPPLVRSVAALPVLLAGPTTDWDKLFQGYHKQLEFDIGEDFIAANGPRSFGYFTLARWACIPFSLLGGCVCWVWARALYGRLAGLLALGLWCFCPLVLGNGQMITPDTGAAALGAAAGYTFWRWLRRPSRSGAVLAGLTLGLAELTKTTWIVLFALWPGVWLAWRWTNRRAPLRPGWFPQAGQVGGVLLLGLWVLNLGYGFEGSFEPLGNYAFVSDALRGPPEEPTPQSGNRFAGTWLGALPVPVPRHYLLGIDEQKRDFEQTFPSYLRGEWRQGGWWYYYLYGLVVKLPLGTWVLLLLAGAVTLRARRYLAPRRHEGVLLAPAAVVLALVSSQTGFNHHLRYVFPAAPFLFVWASKVAQPKAWGGWPLPALVLGAALWSVTSSLCVFPHSLSYFNELAGGPAGGHAHLVDSNIDWGQDLLYLKGWLDEHPGARPLRLAYFGCMDPRAAGIDFSLPPPGPPGARHGTPAEALGPQPGWHAVSVTLLRGYPFRLHDGHGGTIFVDPSCYTYFQRFRPVATAGYSIYVYHIDRPEADRARGQLDLPPLAPPQPTARPRAVNPGGPLTVSPRAHQRGDTP